MTQFEHVMVSRKSKDTKRATDLEHGNKLGQ